MDRTRAKLLFAVVELLLLPISIVGQVLFVGRLSIHNYRTGESATTYDPLIIRWVLHRAGQRRDDAAIRMTRALPGTSEFGLALMAGPTILAMHASGYVPSVLRYPIERSPSALMMINHWTTFFDRALDDRLSEVEQVVVLDAGWDTRAYVPGEEAGLPVFEIDTEAMGKRKRRVLDDVDIEAEHVTFVAADDDRESWFEPLDDAGFDREKPTLFLWEGATMYTDPDTVARTLEAVGTGMESCSSIVFDYFNENLVEGEGPLAVRVATLALEATGEEVTFGVPVESSATDAGAGRFLDEYGLTVTRYEPLGGNGDEAIPLGGLVIAANDRE